MLKSLAASYRKNAHTSRYQITAGDHGVAQAIGDVIEGAANWELWGVLAYNDIRQRYRRSVLGPFWLTISMGLMIATIGVVYAELFRQPVADYLPFLALGFIAWGLISGIVIDSCHVFTGSEGIIRQVRVPYSTHVFRMLWRNLIILAHNMLIYVLILFVFGIKPNAALLLAVPAVMLICLNGLWMGMLLGALSARFRDMPPIMTNVMQIFFYITPIVWKPGQLTHHPAVVYLNPVHYFIDLLREPLLGKVPSVITWFVVLAITATGVLTSLSFLARFRRRIAYWM